MQYILSKRISKAIVDILLLTGLILSIISARKSPGNHFWGSTHCIVSMTWYVLMLIHIWQHWRMVKSLAKRKVFRRNIVTSLTVVAFILMTFTIVVFIVGISDILVHIHHIIAHIFWAVVIIHAVAKSKRFILLFKNILKP